MAAELGPSKSTVQRVWTQTRLKPHQLDRYMASNDRHFERFRHRLDRVLPLSPGLAERHGFDIIVTESCLCMLPWM
jgi:hypothetical protein